MPRTRTPAKKAPVPRKTASPKRAAAPLSLREVMAALEKAGTEQARRTYTRHGGTGPMFGVSFADLKKLVHRIGADHDLARALFATGNLDARTLAVKIADPARVTPAELDAWASAGAPRFCGGYVAMLAAESPHGVATAERWLAAPAAALRSAAWQLVGQLASREPSLPDAWFLARLATAEKGLRSAPNWERYAMNGAVIAIGGRNAALRKAALAAAKRIGTVEVDHGDTECKTPDARAYIEKTWAHADAKGFDSPTAQEMAREAPRTRC